MNKFEAFSKFIDTDFEEGSDENPANEMGENIYEYMGEEYLVLTDEEADKLCAEKIKESLWAFNVDFLIPFLDCTKELEGLGVQEFKDCVRSIQEKMCESANSFIEALVGRNLSWLIQDAIASDGRGHFLSPYDGEEHEFEGYFFYQQ